MADNTTITAQTGGDVIRDKDRGGTPAVKTQIVALDLNPAGATETLMAGFIPEPPDMIGTATLTAVDTTTISGGSTGILEIIVPDGYAGWEVQFTGTFSVGTVIQFEASTYAPPTALNQWFNIQARRNGTPAGSTSEGTSATGDGTAQAWLGICSTRRRLRFRVSALTASDSIAAQVLLTVAPPVGVPLVATPSGANTIGAIHPASAFTLGVVSGNVGAPFYATGTVAFAAASVIAAPGAGLSIYVTDMEGSNEGAAGTAIAFSEGAATPVRYRRFLAASGGGFVANLRTPWKLPANTALWAVVTAATTWNYTLNYYLAP